MLNRRSLRIEEIREDRASAFDFYVFMREAYIQNRELEVADAIGKVRSDEAPDDDDLYYFEDEEGE